MMTLLDPELKSRSYSSVSGSMVMEKAVAELKWIVVTCLCGGFLGIEFPGHNKLTFTGICGHMLWSWVVDVLAAAKELQGG